MANAEGIKVINEILNDTGLLSLGLAEGAVQIWVENLEPGRPMELSKNEVIQLIIKLGDFSAQGLLK